MIKKSILSTLLVISALCTFAQTGSITNISVQPRTDGSGMIDVHFDLSGEANGYNILMEVSFDAGNTYTPIPTTYLSGDLQGVSPGSCQVVWDGYGSFPDEFSEQTRVKIIANSGGGGSGDDTQVVEVLNPTTGKIWMDRNLGASRAATSSTDAQAYGHLYQWGRAADGHQVRTSGTTSTLSNSDTPGHGDFIEIGWFEQPNDWRSPQNHNLWQGVSGINNPCPVGYRLPTEAELNAERLSWSSTNSAGAFASPLKLPVAGGRYFSYGSLDGVGSYGYYWSSTLDGPVSRSLFFASSYAYIYSTYRAYGLSVRCLKDTYTLSINVSPEGIGQVSGAGEYAEGTTVTITATPNEKYQFVNWTGDTDHIADASAAGTILIMPAQDVNLTANFEISDDNIQPGEGVTDIDGNFYSSVIIGNQEWMAENLKTTKYRNGTPIDYPGTDNTAWQNNTTGAYAWYSWNDILWMDYGALYNWYAVNNSNGLCPAGWHVPSYEDLIELVDYLDAQGYPNEYDITNGAGNVLKSCRQVSSPLGGDCDTSLDPRWNSHHTYYGTDLYGFSALPGGIRNYQDGNQFYYFRSYGFWWTSTEYLNNYPWRFSIDYNHSAVNMIAGEFYTNKSGGYSVRCLRVID